MNRFVAPRRVPRGRLLGAAVAIFVVGAALTAPAMAADETASAPVLVTLGDSFTSGTGLGSYRDGSDESGCYQSTKAYGAVAATQLGAKSVNLACSGSPMDALEDGFKGQDPQLEQLEAVDAQAGVDYVALTIGGNDAIDLVRTASWDDLDELIATAKTYYPSLINHYRNVASAAPGADVFVLGYPTVFPLDQDAMACVPEQYQGVPVASLTVATEGLNAMIAQAVDAASNDRIHFVEPADFTGHGLCADDSWVFDFTNFGQPDDGTLHPTAVGHQKIAATLTEAINSLPVTSPPAAEAPAVAVPSDDELTDIPADDTTTGISDGTAEEIDKGLVDEGLLDLPVVTETDQNFIDPATGNFKTVQQLADEFDATHAPLPACDYPFADFSFRYDSTVELGKVVEDTSLVLPKGFDRQAEIDCEFTNSGQDRFWDAYEANPSKGSFAFDILDDVSLTAACPYAVNDFAMTSQVRWNGRTVDELITVQFPEDLNVFELEDCGLYTGTLQTVFYTYFLVSDVSAVGAGTNGEPLAALEDVAPSSGSKPVDTKPATPVAETTKPAETTVSNDTANGIVTGTPVAAESTPAQAEVQSGSTTRAEPTASADDETQATLAYTGSSGVPAQLAMGFLFAGLGLALLWLRLVARDRAYARG